jgi:succinate dehydrogenase/fumarate reductase cytochrome b subunit
MANFTTTRITALKQYMETHNLDALGISVLWGVTYGAVRHWLNGVRPITGPVWFIIKRDIYGRLEK